VTIGASFELSHRTAFACSLGWTMRGRADLNRYEIVATHRHLAVITPSQFVDSQLEAGFFPNTTACEDFP
jgi:hypothetical protein